MPYRPAAREPLTGAGHRQPDSFSTVPTVPAESAVALGDMIGLFKRGWDKTTATRFLNGNANQLKEMLANKLAIAEPGPGYCHFGPETRGFDEEFFLQILSERKEKRKHLGVIATRWVQHRARNEGLDLLCMIICNVEELFRGRLDTMEAQVSTPGKTEKPEPSNGERDRLKWRT